MLFAARVGFNLGWQAFCKHLNASVETICILTLVFIIYHSYVIWYRLRKHPLAKIPGPKLRAAYSIPFLYTTYIEGTAIYKVADMHRKYGPIVRISPDQIAVDGAVGWPSIYGHSTKRPEFPKPPDGFYPGDTEGLVAAPQEKHRRIRRQLAPGFGDSALAKQEDTLTQYADILVERLAIKCRNKGYLNLTTWFNYTTFDIISDLTFSQSFECLTRGRYHPWVKTVFDGREHNALRHFISAFLPVTWFIKTFLMKELHKDLHGRSDLAIQRMHQGSDGSKGRVDIMTHMLRDRKDNQQPMTELEIMNTVPVIIVAGSETTASALAGLFYYLLQNPAKERILVLEIRQAFQSESDITLRSTGRLEYLQACIQEILRIYPPVAATPPRLSPGAEVVGYYIPEGTIVWVHQWATFRNPEHFHRPDEYLPERWLTASHPLYDASFETDNRAVFKPFSYGPRDCLGKNFAYAEMRLLTARLLYRFKMTMTRSEGDWHTRQKNFEFWVKQPLEVKLDAYS